MALQKFGSVYLDLSKITYVKTTAPEVRPPSAVRMEQVGNVRIGFEQSEITLLEYEPGYEEFIQWLETQSI